MTEGANKMRIFVAGATGAVGRRLVPRLVERGHAVVGTTRTAGKVAELEALGAEAAVVDALDAAAVGEAVARAEPDAIIHQMTALAGKPDLRRFDKWFDLTNRLRTRGTENLLAAAQATGVRRLVVQSFVGWNLAPTGGPIKTEDDPLDPEPLRWQRESMAAIRFLETAVPAAPLDGIVLRYGALYGPGGSDDMVKLVKARKFPIVGAGGGIWSFTHLDDAATAAIVAAEQGGHGIYHVVDDDPAPSAVWLPEFAEAIGAKPPRRVPVWLARIVAGEVPVRWMTEGRGASNARFKAEFGWEPIWPSWRQGFRHALFDPVPEPARA
jgi:nucleoside-diphosphate-sugar epimerase